MKYKYLFITVLWLASYCFPTLIAASDYAYLYALGSTDGQTVTSNISFDGIQAPVGTNIFLLNDTEIVINDIGYFQVSFGMSPISTNMNVEFCLQTTVGGVVTSYNSLSFTNNNTGITVMNSMTTIVNVTQRGTILTINNASGSDVVLNGAAGNNTEIAAYVTIIKVD